MIGYDCDEIRDLLPVYTRGELPPHESAALDGHLVVCARCRGDAEVVRLLQETLAPVPAGLEGRVLASVRTVRRRRLPRRSRLALAATLAAAVVGGSLLFGRTGGPDAGATLDAGTLSWAAAHDPLLHDRSELQQLSVEELEAILSELDR